MSERNDAMNPSHRSVENSMTPPVAAPPSQQSIAVPPRRRWLSLSLRTLMILVLLLAVWLAQQVNRARGVRRAIDAIEAGGDIVRFEGRDARHLAPGST